MVNPRARNRPIRSAVLGGDLRSGGTYSDPLPDGKILPLTAEMPERIVIIVSERIEPENEAIHRLIEAGLTAQKE